jgi:hypothetical protein
MRPDSWAGPGLGSHFLSRAFYWPGLIRPSPRLCPGIHMIAQTSTLINYVGNCSLARALASTVSLNRFQYGLGPFLHVRIARCFYSIRHIIKSLPSLVLLMARVSFFLKGSRFPCLRSLPATYHLLFSTYFFHFLLFLYFLFYFSIYYLFCFL